MITVALIDDHELFRIGVTSFIELSGDVKVIKQYSTGKEALEDFQIALIQLYLIDLSLATENGLDIALEIKNKDPLQKIVILSAHKNSYYFTRALNIGVNGYLVKDSGPEELVFAIKKVISGSQYFSLEMSNQFISQKFATPTNSDINLSPREKEVTNLLIYGLTSNEIGKELSISTRTVDTHRAHILKKFKVKNTIELLRVCMDNDLL